MHEYEAGIIRTEYRWGKTHIIHLSCEAIAREAVPGQFVQVRVSTGTDPFLRRTFSLCGADPESGCIKLMFEVVGRGTELLAGARRGGCLSVIGPLGKGFELDSGDDGVCVLVAGGVGVAPLVFLAEALRNSEMERVILMAGARTAEWHDACEGLFGEHIMIMKATDDGSLGFHGTVNELFEEQFKSFEPNIMYTCGPYPMMKAVAAIASKAGIRCQASMEERMACGLGACYGCAVPLRDGRMVRSCVEGPVFDASEVDW